MKCDSGFLQKPNSNGSCQNCNIDNCSYCRQVGICEFCMKGFFFNNGVCNPCHENCDFCSNLTECITCKGNFSNLPPGICCSIGSFLDENKSCQLCSIATANCSDCMANKTCIACQQGYTLIKGICCANNTFLDENLSCQQCSKATDHCSNCLMNKTCIGCQQNYILNEGICCEIGSYFYENLSCQPCSKATSNCSNCLPNKTCIECQPGFALSAGKCACSAGSYLDENKSCQLCSKATSNCSNCLTNKTCIECKQGYTLIAGKCACSAGLYLDENLICQLCSKTANYCSDCLANKTCTGCQLGYILNTSSQCILNQTTNNSTTSSKKPNANIKSIIINNNIPNIMFNCSIPSQIYYVYGLQNSIDNIVLNQIKLKNTVNSKEWELETIDEIYWTGYGGTTSGYLSFNVTKKLKNSGEIYKIKLWCISTSENIESDPISSNWTQPDNSARPTNVTIKVNSSSKSSKKTTNLLGNALIKALDIATTTYTNDGSKITTATKRRILQSSNQYGVSFYVMPDYSAIIDNTSSLISEKLANPTAFLANLSTAMVTLNPGEDLGLNFIGVSYSVLPNNFEQTQPEFQKEFPNITVSFKSMRFDLELTQDGTINIVVLPFNSSSSSMSANLSSNLISYNELMTFSNVNSVEVSKNVSSNVIAKGFSKGSEYIVYYAGINKQTPALYTDVYSQMIKTKDGLNLACGFGLSLMLFFSFFLIN